MRSGRGPRRAGVDDDKHPQRSALGLGSMPPCEDHTSFKNASRADKDEARRAGAPV